METDVGRRRFNLVAATSCYQHEATGNNSELRIPPYAAGGVRTLNAQRHSRTHVGGPACSRQSVHRRSPVAHRRMETQKYNHRSKIEFATGTTSLFLNTHEARGHIYVVPVCRDVSRLPYRSNMHPALSIRPTTHAIDNSIDNFTTLLHPPMSTIISAVRPTQC